MPGLGIMKKTTAKLALTTSIISSLIAQGQLADGFKDGGNAAPQITKRSEAEEKVFLDDVKVPDPFKVTLFAAPPADRTLASGRRGSAANTLTRR